MYRNYDRPPQRIPDRRYRDDRLYKDNRRYSDGSMSIKQWIGTFIILAIPGINVIAWLVWLFGGGNNRTRINFIRASLIMTLIVSAITVVAYFTMKDIIVGLIDKYLPTNAQTILSLFK